MSIRRFNSEGYNYLFDTETGFFVRWGKTREDDPFFSPFGPELLDIEVSDICSRECSWCYKSNNKNGGNMSLSVFERILNKIPKALTQIAFGIGDLDANPDLIKMLIYTRKKGYVPNITINGIKIDEEWAYYLANLCGAIAVSHYNDAKCYNAVNLLSTAGLKQVNIHKLVAKETYDSVFNLLENCKNDKRLKKLNAVVFLSLKQKGMRNIFNPLNSDEFSEIIKAAMKLNVNIGFDSCSARKFLNAVQNHPHYDVFKLMAEPCESACFSMYINRNGIAYPCSFLEGEAGYKGINMMEIKDFLREVWYGEEFRNFRGKLKHTDRNCPHFKI